MVRPLVLAALVLSSGGAALEAQTPVTTVRGIVRDSIGAPLAGAEVVIGRRSGLTSPTGVFLVDSVPAGRHTLTVRRIGMAPVREQLEVPSGGLSGLSYVLHLAASVLPTVVVEAERPGIYGTVALVAERPAVGARVQLVGPGGREVRADSGGRFSFPGLRQGEYLVRVVLPGYTERRVGVTLGRNEGRELAINLLPSNRIISRADVGALDDLEKRLSIGMRADRIMGADLALRGRTDVCDLPQLRSVVGRDEATTTIIVNGTTIYRDMPVYALCSWRADEVEVVEFARNVCSDRTGTVAQLLGVWCGGGASRMGITRSLSGRTGRMSGSPASGGFVIIWERR